MMTVEVGAFLGIKLLQLPALLMHFWLCSIQSGNDRDVFRQFCDQVHDSRYGDRPRQYGRVPP